MKIVEADTWNKSNWTKLTFESMCNIQSMILPWHFAGGFHQVPSIRVLGSHSLYAFRLSRRVTNGVWFCVWLDRTQNSHRSRATPMLSGFMISPSGNDNFGTSYRGFYWWSSEGLHLIMTGSLKRVGLCILSVVCARVSSTRWHWLFYSKVAILFDAVLKGWAVNFKGAVFLGSLNGELVV